MTEKRGLSNGIAVPLEDYGTISSSDTEKLHIIGGDQLQNEHDSFVNETPWKSKPGQWDPTLDEHTFFRDGKRQIDFVLVYEDDMETLELKKQGKIGKKEKDKMTARDKQEVWRTKFLNNLKKVGLEMEEETVESKKKMIYYVKLHAPWDVLCFYAENLCLRAPLQAHPNPSANWSENVLRKLHIPNIMSQNVPNTPLDYYTCAFRSSKLNRFLGSDDQDNFFFKKDRGRVVYEILASTCYGKRKRAELGIDRMLDEEVFAAAFPLHDGPHEMPKNVASHESLNPRQILYEYWARWGRWYKYQPLDHIREYFGEKIGIYFAWLGFYTAWLLPASFVGLAVFMYGVFTMGNNVPAIEVCHSNKTYQMCPLCSENIGCKYWYLSEICVFSTISYLFDHPGTVFFAVFMSFWAVSFLEYWKRKNASLAHHWDCLDFEEEEERPRPEYAAMCTEMEKNPITGVKEPHFPPRSRLPRIMSGMGVVIVMVVLVVIFIVAVIMYRVLIAIPLFQNESTRAQATTIASVSSAVVNLILIMALGRVYEKLALKLTQWEMHRTQSEYEDQLIFKVFIFQFVNFYSSIIYIGFFKGKFIGYPGNYVKFFGLRNEECQNGGCLIELAQQLAVIMIGKQVINNAQELIVPKVKAFIHHWQMGTSDKGEEKSPWEEDYELIANEGLFDEYLEMILQFGFITIFVAAFPLAPLFALLNNWLEIRLDAHKFVCETRRPVADRAQDIGVWFTILDALAQLAVISNAFLLAFTSEFLPRLMYKYKYNWDLVGYINFTLAWAPNGTLSEPCRYTAFRDDEGHYTMFYWKLLCIRLAFIIIFEHVVFGICKLIDILVPDVPESLELKIKRERYLAKQALADTDNIMQIVNDGAEEVATDQVTLEVPEPAAQQRSDTA